MYFVFLFFESYKTELGIYENAKSHGSNRSWGGNPPKPFTKLLPKFVPLKAELYSSKSILHPICFFFFLSYVLKSGIHKNEKATVRNGPEAHDESIIFIVQPALLKIDASLQVRGASLRETRVFESYPHEQVAGTDNNNNNS